MSTASSSFRIPAPRAAAVIDFGLVSDLPPVVEVSPSFFDRLKARASDRRQNRSFEKAVRNAGFAEQHDLLTANRRS